MSAGMEDSKGDCDVLTAGDNEAMAEVHNLIVGHQTISHENALVLNEAMLAKLRAVLQRLEANLKKCRAKYEENEKIIAEHWQKANGANRNVPGIFNEQILAECQYPGYPYFKTRSGKTHELNAEAQYRQSLGTLYPYDLFRLQRTQWTLADKGLLIRGIKEALAKSCVANGMVLSPDPQLSDLVRNVQGTDFQFNWTRLSVQLSSRHTPFECEAMWRLFLHPDLSRAPWEIEEDQRLLDIGSSYNFQNWPQIAAEMGGSRSMFQCFLQYHSKHRVATARATGDRFTTEEDQRLQQLVNQYRVGNVIPWPKIVQHFPNRNKQTLYYRYTFSLNPSIIHEKFSAQEDCLLIAAVHEYGLDFPRIARDFPHRTIVQLRAHYNNVIKCRNSPWTLAEDRVVLKLHANGKGWAHIADVLKTHNRGAVRMRYHTIVKYLKKHPQKKLKDVPRKSKKCDDTVTMDNWTTRLTEVSRQVRDFSDPSIMALASYLNAFGTKVTADKLGMYVNDFTEDEIDMLTVVRNKPIDVKVPDHPVHVPLMRTYLRMKELFEQKKDLLEPYLPSQYSRVETHRTEFKKQFKKIFYQPAVMASIVDDEPKLQAMVIESDYGPITVQAVE